MYENWDKICTNETPKHNIDKTRRSAKVHLDLTCRGHCPSASRGSEFDLLRHGIFIFLAYQGVKRPILLRASSIQLLFRPLVALIRP